MTTAPQGRILAARFASDIASYLQDQGIDVSAQVAHDDAGNFHVGNLVGADRWILKTNRKFRIKLSESLDEAEKEAKSTGKDLATVIQFRMDSTPAEQYCILTLASLAKILKAIP